MATPDRRGPAAGTEEDFLLQAGVLDLLPGHWAGGDHPAALVVRTPPRGRTSPHAGRGQHDLRGPVPVLLPARHHLFRLYGHFLEPVPRGDAGEDAALLLPDSHAAGTAGGGQISGGPGGGPDVVCRQHGGGLPAPGPPLRPGVERLPVPRPGPEPAWQLHAGGGARLRRLRRGIPDVRVVVPQSPDSGGGGFCVGEPEPVPAGPAEEDQHHFLPEEPVPGGSPGAAAILGDGGGVRPDPPMDRRARTAGGCGDPADLLGHLGAANGNQLRGVATESAAARRGLQTAGLIFSHPVALDSFGDFRNPPALEIPSVSFWLLRFPYVSPGLVYVADYSAECGGGQAPVE